MAGCLDPHQHRFLGLDPHPAYPEIADHPPRISVPAAEIPA
jgi:hypothetical protein